MKSNKSGSKLLFFSIKKNHIVKFKDEALQGEKFSIKLKEMMDGLFLSGRTAVACSVSQQTAQVELVQL